MTAKGGVREQVRAALLENIGLKLVSLLCALILYAVLHAENAQRTFSVRILSLMPPNSANRTLVTQLPTEVSVTLSGSRTQIDDLHADDLSVQLDLRSGRKASIDLESSMFQVPPGLTVEQIIPSSIELRWDDVIFRSIQVQVARTGEPLPGFTVKGAIVVDPPNVQAQGPRSIVEVMQFARAAPFDVSGLAEGVYRRQLLLDKAPNLVEYDRENVTATVEIARELVKKEFVKLKVEVIGVPRATTVPPTVKVTVTGTAEDVNALTPEAIVPRVEPKAAGNDTAKPGSDILPVYVDVGRAKAEVDPPKVIVKW